MLDLRKDIAETEAVSAGSNKQALHKAIQAKFKDWLVSSGNMRQGVCGWLGVWCVRVCPMFCGVHACACEHACSTRTRLRQRCTDTDTQRVVVKITPPSATPTTTSVSPPAPSTPLPATPLYLCPSLPTPLSVQDLIHLEHPHIESRTGSGAGAGTLHLP